VLSSEKFNHHCSREQIFFQPAAARAEGLGLQTTRRACGGAFAKLARAARLKVALA